MADVLVSDHNFVKVALADPLKRIVRDVYAFTDDQLWGPSETRNIPDERYPRPCRSCHGHGHYSADHVGLDEKCPDCNGTRITCLPPREALQRLGSEWGRECYPDTWAALGVRTANQILTGAYNYTQKEGLLCQPSSFVGVVIPDVRFRNEIKMIKEAGGKVIRVLRDGAGLEGVYGRHQSESEQRGIPDSEFDSVVQNNQTLDHLREATTKAVSTLI